jgi:recombination protein RecA
MAIDSEKEKSVGLAISQIEKQFGKGSIMKLGQAGAVIDIPVISTGSLALDYALGVGGVPRGRVVEISRSFLCQETRRECRFASRIPA